VKLSSDQFEIFKGRAWFKVLAVNKMGPGYPSEAYMFSFLSQNKPMEEGIETYSLYSWGDNQEA
jgi:hypothetical protein